VLACTEIGATEKKLEAEDADWDEKKGRLTAALRRARAKPDNRISEITPVTRHATDAPKSTRMTVPEVALIGERSPASDGAGS
jgi:hypothetical protein